MTTGTDQLDRRLADTEDWLRRRGVPTLVRDRRTSTEVWASARWWLITLLVLEVFTAFSDRYTGWAQFGVFVAAVVLTVAAMAAFNLVRRRRPFETPTEIAWPELAFFVFFPPLLVLIVGGDPLRSALIALAGQLIALVIAWALVALGVGWMLRWAVRVAAQHAADVARLVARSIPLLLLLTVFMFINAEAWQVAHGMVRSSRPVVAGGIMLIGAAFLWFGADDLVDDADTAEGWDDAHERVRGTPMEGFAPPAGAPLPLARLGKPERINLRLLLATSVAVQATLVAALLAVAYVVLGVVLVPDAVLASWLGSTESDPVELVVLWEFDLRVRTLFLYEVHVIVATAVALLAGLNVIVASLTDDTYRKTFSADLVADIEQNLAVHRVMLAAEQYRS